MNKIAYTSKESEHLAQIMEHCYGTDNYHSELGLPFYYTDGMKTFCDTAQAYWIFDIVMSVMKTEPKMLSDLIAITLLVNNDNTATISFKNSEETFYTQEIPYTDCPCGE